ncbi:agamous-like MADS-box protein AGL29 [Miscanthus floridulus]|uniref:agamous-like MADS-box protein AGL29 n=1 Tax=Miscanthus floridulus TaxID=154761 RepID=UPI003459C434
MRKSGFFKKASELSLLYGVRGAVAVFSATDKPSAVGAHSVELVISRFAPLPSDGGGGGDDDRDREVMEATARRAKETGARVAEEKTRMGAVGEKVLRVTAAGGVRFWWQADAEALGEEELREFARKLHRLRGNVRHHADKLQVAPASQRMTGL